MDPGDPFYWMLPAIGRRLRVVTPVDMINMRFGHFVGLVFKTLGVLTAPISMGLGIKSAALVLEVMTGGAVDGTAAMLIITVPTLLYTLMGGALSARSEMTARLSILGTLVKRVCTVGWGLTGLFAVALYAGHSELADSPDKVFPLAAGDLLPVVLRGLLVASVLGAVMSSLDTALVGTAGIVTKNFYEEYFVRKASPGHYLFMTRLFAVLITVAALAWACAARGLIDYILLVEPLASLTGLAFFVCLFWRRTTKWGAIASVVVMFPLFFVLQKTALVEGLASLPFGIRQAARWLQAGYAAIGTDIAIPVGERVFLPIEIMYPLYLVPGLVALVVASLLTRQHNRRDVDLFYARVDTPLGAEHKLVAQGYAVDDLAELDSEVAEVEKRDARDWGRLLVPDLLRLLALLLSGEARLRDYRVDLVGFAVSVLIVLLFLAGVQWLGSPS